MFRQLFGKLSVKFLWRFMVRGDTHITSILSGGAGTTQKWDVIGRRGVRVRECSGRPIFIFFTKENWICTMTRLHAETNINILLTRNLPFDSDVRQWSHPLMIQLHFLWAKLNNRMRGQFECDLIWICFCYGFVRSYARYGK